MNWNANTGRSTSESNPPLPPSDANSEVGGVILSLEGSTLTAQWDCNTRDDLVGTLGALHFILPLSLGTEFQDPIVVATTSGSTGEAQFVWQVAQTGSQFEIIDQAERNARCLRAFERLPMLSDPSNARVLAATAYFQQAARLLAVGSGPSEFAGEALVNLAKVLEALFPERPDRTREAARVGLAQLGYESAEVEKFISCLVVRSSLDAAHVRMATLATDERQKLQVFLEGILQNFRNLMTRIIDGIIAGTFVTPTYVPDRSDGDDLSQIIDRL
jgi:hypothetical protein